MLETHEESAAFRPCVVLALIDGEYATRTARAFRLLGWDVYTAPGGPAARRLARMLEASLVLLDAELPGESGWLTCDKLHRELPVRVFIVADSAGPWQQALGDLVGAAAVIDRHCAPANLVQQHAGELIPAAG
jgi:DNA-binding response OmpR family regulator